MSVPARPRVVLLRGHSANLWDLRPWEGLREAFDVEVLLTASNQFDVSALALSKRSVRSVRGALPSGRAGNLAAYALGERYLGLGDALAGADIVHAAEIDSWFSAQAAREKARRRFRLVLTVWETIPSTGALRWPRERRRLDGVLAAADLLLAATERAARALRLEGADPARIMVCPPGIDTEHFASAPAPPAAEHLVLSPGRLVWEKGHQDALRAVAALNRGLLGDVPPTGALIVGSGPEEKRLRALARDLGLGDRAEFRAHVPYREMPALYRRASAMTLASLPRRGWEEQFGMVLAEAMSTGCPVLAARSGAIPEVLGQSPGAVLFDPGDWWALAEALRDGPLARPPGMRVEHDRALVRRYSAPAAAERLRGAYERLLSPPVSGREAPSGTGATAS